jgi:hypothetical protein
MQNISYKLMMRCGDSSKVALCVKGLNLLKPEVHENNISKSVPTSHKTRCSSVTKTSQLMLFRQIAVYSDTNTMPINTFRGQNAGFLMGAGWGRGQARHMSPLDILKIKIEQLWKYIHQILIPKIKTSFCNLFFYADYSLVLRDLKL